MFSGLPTTGEIEYFYVWLVGVCPHVCTQNFTRSCFSFIKKNYNNAANLVGYLSDPLANVTSL